MEIIINWLTLSLNNKSVSDIVIDLLLPTLSLISMFLATSSNERIRTAGFCCGLCNQILWFKLAIASHSLGLLINVICFTGLWIYRVVQAFIRMKRKKVVDVFSVSNKATRLAYRAKNEATGVVMADHAPYCDVDC